VIGSGAIALTMSFVLFMERAGPQIFVTSIMACTIALLPCITFILNRPFNGTLALSPEPFLHSVQVFDSVDDALKENVAARDVAGNR
jgi:hypothetical protein